LVCSLNAGWDCRIEDFGDIRARAGVAQLVEHPICNREVAGSSPFAGSRENRSAGSLGFVIEHGQLAEWLMAADCKSAALCATEVQILHCPP
jgi:hypothetical protein